MMNTKTLVNLTMAGALVATASVVKANPELELISGSTVITVVQSTAVGSTSFSGTVGQWTIDIAVGDNSLGGPEYIDLDSLVGGAGKPLLPLTIEYTSGGYTSGGPVIGEIGGTTTTSVSDYQYLGYAPFGHGTLLDASGPFTAGAFSGTAYGNTGPISGPYWLTEEVVIGGAGSTRKGSGPESTSFDANSNVVPDSGMTMALLGSAFAGLGAMRSRFGSKRA